MANKKKMNEHLEGSHLTKDQKMAKMASHIHNLEEGAWKEFRNELFIALDEHLEGVLVRLFAEWRAKMDEELQRNPDPGEGPWAYDAPYVHNTRLLLHPDNKGDGVHWEYIHNEFWRKFQSAGFKPCQEHLNNLRKVNRIFEGSTKDQETIDKLTAALEKAEARVEELEEDAARNPVGRPSRADRLLKDGHGVLDVEEVHEMAKEVLQKKAAKEGPHPSALRGGALREWQGDMTREEAAEACGVTIHQYKRMLAQKDSK